MEYVYGKWANRTEQSFNAQEIMGMDKTQFECKHYYMHTTHTMEREMDKELPIFHGKLCICFDRINANKLEWANVAAHRFHAMDFDWFLHSELFV